MADFEPLRNSSKKKINFRQNVEDNKWQECKKHPKNDIFMVCMEHNLGICDECINSSEHDMFCSTSRTDCKMQSLAYYSR